MGNLGRRRWVGWRCTRWLVWEVSEMKMEGQRTFEEEKNRTFLDLVLSEGGWGQGKTILRVSTTLVSQVLLPAAASLSPDEENQLLHPRNSVVVGPYGPFVLGGPRSCWWFISVKWLSAPSPKEFATHQQQPRTAHHLWCWELHHMTLITADGRQWQIFIQKKNPLLPNEIFTWKVNGISDRGTEKNSREVKDAW